MRPLQNRARRIRGRPNPVARVRGPLHQALRVISAMAKANRAMQSLRVLSMNRESNEERLVRLETQQEQAATKTDIANLEAGLARLETRLVKWMVGVALAAVIAGGAIVTAVEKLL